MSVTLDTAAACNHVPDKLYLTLPETCKVVNTLSETHVELHGHNATVQVLAKLRLVHNRDMHLLALRKLMKSKKLDESIFPPVVHDFARWYYH